MRTRPPREVLFQCKLCPNKGSERYINGVGARCKAYNVCHSCDFWLTVLGYVHMGYVDCDDNRILVIDGNCYTVLEEGTIVPEDYGKRGTGFSGQARTYVLFDDPTETVMVSRNTWMMGTVPREFRDLIEDNARYGDQFTLAPYKFEGMTGL